MDHPAGWYPNPVDASQLRWWDGNAWTDDTHPMPGYQPGWDAPPAKRRRLWPFIVFPLLGLMLVFGVAAAIFVPKVIGAFKHPIDAANVYYGDLRDGRLADAYANVCAPFRNGLSFEQYAARVREEEATNGHVIRFNAHVVHRVSGHSDQAVVDMDITTTQRTVSAEVTMRNENGHWHFCGRR